MTAAPTAAGAGGVAVSPRAPDATGTDGLKMVALVVGSLMILIAVVGGMVWMSAERDTPPTSAPTAPAVPAAPASPETMPAPAVRVVHADVYFDFKSSRLRGDQVPVLQEHARLVHGEDNWRILLQGHTDRRGPTVYNRVLAEQRADTVKRFLVELGVPDASIRTATVGPEGTVCADPGPECQQLNRRVHIEMRRLTPSTSAPVAVPADEIGTP